GYNLARSGYGPHQMLRMLETERFDRAVGDGPVNLVIYQGITEHVARMLGSTWDPRGPRYVMTADNQHVVYVGPFHGKAYFPLLQWLLKSELFSHFAWLFFDERPRVEDLPLYIAILKQTQWEVERRYGEGSFVILFWLFWYEKEVLGVDPTAQFK